jgi:steroid delta-isomerase-like uncharacterized protein
MRPSAISLAFVSVALGLIVLPAFGQAEGLRAAAQASPAAGTPCATTAPEENEALVRRYYEEAYNGHNPAAVDALLADDFVRHNVAAPQENQEPGNADDAARVASWLSAFPDLQVTIEELFASGDTVVSYVVWRGTQDGPLPQWGAPATGRPMARESLVVWRVVCGRLAGNWIVQDNLTMLRQLGIITGDELATAGTPTVATPAP